MYKVFKILYKKMEVGKSVSHLVVVGDGKTFDLLQKIKTQSPRHFRWLLPFPGDWHILSNFSMALMKVYGPSGLFEILSLLLMVGQKNQCLLVQTSIKHLLFWFRLGRQCTDLRLISFY